MSDISILKEIFKPAVVISLEDDQYNRKQLTLIEPNLYSLVVKGIPEKNSIVIKTDCFPPPTKVFSNAKGECKRADFVVFADIGSKKVILFIELKASASAYKRAHIVKQLKGALCAVKYTQEIGKQFWEECDFLKDYEHRFVCFTDIGIPKKETRARKKEDCVHDSPENMLKISSPHNCQFNYLIGKI